MTEPGAQVPSADPLIWKVRRGPYLVLFLLFYSALSWFIYLASRDTGYLVLLALAGPLVAVPAWRFLWFFLAGYTYRLNGERLDVLSFENTLSIPLREVLVVSSRLKVLNGSVVTSGNGSIVLATAERRVVIPRYLSRSERVLLKALVERIEVAQVPRHLAGSEPDLERGPEDPAPRAEGPWRRYPDLPAPLLELYRELAAKDPQAAAQALLFRGRARKRHGLVIHHLRPYFVWMIVLSLAGLGLAAAQGLKDGPGVAVGFVVGGGFFAALTYLHQLVLRRGEWLVLHPAGLAMLGKHLTGEIEWGKVRGIRNGGWRQPVGGDARPESPTGELGQLAIDGDTSISIPDIYDAPLCVILNLCSHFWERYRDQPARPPVPAGAERSS